MPTLDEVLRESALRLQVLVSAPTDIPVRWVATSELDDPTPFLEGGEIVLTTGLATATWGPEDWDTYVERLHAAGAAALGLGIGLTHHDVPTALLAAARKIRLALFTVPRAVPFVAVSRAVARLLQQEEQRALQSALAVQQQLTQAAVGADGAAAILDRLARLVRGEAVVCDHEATVLLRDHGAATELRPSRLPTNLDELVARLRPKGLRASHSESGPRGAMLIQPIGLTGAPRAYLVISTSAPWDGAARTAVATAAALLSLDFERRADVLATAREIRAAALDLFFGGRPEPAQALLELPAAQAAPLSGTLFHVLRMNAIDVTVTLPALERWAAADSSARLVAVSPSDKQPVALFRTDTDPAAAAAVLGPGARAGIGEARPLTDLISADATAREALNHASAHRPVVRWAEVVDAGLPALIPGPAAEGFARAVLGPLATPSAEATTLLATLDAFHRHHGQITVIASALGVHRNTVTRRLQRVAELTGRVPETPRGRFELWMAVEILRGGAG